MYKNRRPKASAPLSSQNRSTLTNSLVSSTSSVGTTPQASVSVPAHVENVDPDVSPAKKMRQSQQVNVARDEDMFEIPSSQNPTQSRFSSQRSIMARTQSILAIQRQPKNYFENVLIKCGVGLESMECYVLTCNHLNFMTKVRDMLRSNDNFPENIKDFVSGVTDAMKTYMTLAKLFSGCKLSLPSSDSIYQSQESLIKDLLMIDFLQEQLIEVLFDKIETFVGDDETLKLDIPYVDLILSELKFLNIVEHGDAVSSKVFALFDLATTSYQQVIIRSIPDIIDVSRHDEAMEKLMRTVTDDTDLLAFSNVDTFRNMHLNAKNLSQLRTKIISHMRYRASHECFPSFVKFILRTNSDEIETLPKIISDLRSCLGWNITAENQKEVHANQKEVFDSIERSLCASKQIYENWLKIIQSTSLDDQKSVDLIVLLILATVNEDKAFYIEQLIRKKIKTEQFNTKILDELMDDFVVILKEYLTPFISILDKLFRDKNDSIVAFATHGFKTLFAVEHISKTVLLSKLIEYVCQNQIGSETGTNALRILNEFNENNPTEMQKYALQLLRMLDRASELNLAQYRMIMNILCSIAYPLLPMTGSVDLQNHIDMLLKKQVASSTSAIKNLGIVGVVQTIDHLVWTTESIQSQPGEMVHTIDAIDDVSAKTAARYLDLILSATRTSPESLGLCFDELAAVLSHRNKNNRKELVVNKRFQIWISDFMVQNFQDLFVVDVLPDLEVECEYQYLINSSDDNNTQSEDVEHIGINLAGLTFKPTSNPLGSVLLLPSFFNLLRIIQCYRYGNLVTINALLGCAIVLPKSMNSSTEMEMFWDYDEAKAKKILDLYYLTVNWMREGISAFVSQSGTNMLKKTMTRLNEVINLEQKIRSLLELAPSNYTPPICQFNCSPNKKQPSTQKKPPTTKTRRSKKAQAAAIDVNTETQNVTLFDISNTPGTHAPSRHSAKAKTNFNSLSYGPKEIYRQMDPDIACLLSQELLIKYPLPLGSVGEVLGLVEFKFIMDDLVNKMESIFGVKRFLSDQPMQYVISPSDLFNDLINFLPQIEKFFNQLTNHLYECLSDAESENDASLYTDELNYTKICVGLCLRLFAAFFTWPNFKQEANKPLLKKSLAALAQCSESEDDGTISQLAQQSIENVVRHAPNMHDLQSAVHMLHLIRSLATYSTHPKSNDSVVNLCRKFLSRKWYGYDGTPERGGKCNVLLDDLLKGLMKSATFPKIDELVKITVREAKELAGKNGYLKSFPNFYKANLALLYRSICTALIYAVNEKLGKSAPIANQLKVFEKSTALLSTLSDSVADVNVPRIYGIYLKHAHIYMKVFIQHGIPLIQTGLRSNSEQILQFLKSFNSVASFLHKICCHWKANQNTTIMAQIPFVRETIETMLIKVKAVLAANNCASAFWQNNLKNRNLHNEEILTQSTEEDENDDDEDDELPEDDDSLEDDCLDECDREGSRETSVETTRRISKTPSNASSLLY